MVPRRSRIIHSLPAILTGTSEWSIHETNLFRLTNLLPRLLAKRYAPPFKPSVVSLGVPKVPPTSLTVD
jgi:hypothetical protein